MQRICGSLAAHGYDCLLVGRLRNNSKRLPIFTFRTHRIKCYFEKGKFFYLEYNLRLFFFLLSRNFSAICAIDLDTLFPATLVSSLKKNKLVYDAHEYFTEVPEVVNRKTIKAVWEQVAKTCIPKADSCYTVGPKLAEILGNKYHNDFEVIRNLPSINNSPPVGGARGGQTQEAPAISDFNIAPASNKQPTSNQETKGQKNSPPTGEVRVGQIILYQGALNEGRGLEELIKAAVNLPVKVLVAGEGDLSQSLRKLAKDLGANNVEFLGFIDPTELKAITAKAWLGYNLLENKGLSYYYSLANKYFDYAAAGVPCLISPFPEYLDLNATYNMSVESELKANDIIEKVEQLLKNKEQYNMLSENCLKAANQLNWQNEERKLFEIYDGLFNR